jgi:hypothetical protein
MFHDIFRVEFPHFFKFTAHIGWFVEVCVLNPSHPYRADPVNVEKNWQALPNGLPPHRMAVGQVVKP